MQLQKDLADPAKQRESPVLDRSRLSKPMRMFRGVGRSSGRKPSSLNDIRDLFDAKEFYEAESAICQEVCFQASINLTINELWLPTLLDRV